MSSEAMERRESIHKLCVAWMSVPSLPDNAIPASPDDVLWLLAEVARLEQERDYAAECRDNMQGWAKRAEASGREARAALAVARGREQRLRGALQQIANHNVRAPVTGTSADDPCDWHCTAQQRDLARAALVDEPAAATLAEPEPETDDGRCPGCGWYVADCNCVARAAADEPGETPT